MSTKTIALAAMLLAGGIGTASAQAVVAPGQPAVGPSTPLYRQQVPAVVPLGPHIDKPKVNPSAAGTVTEWEHPPKQTSKRNTREHSGSVGANANTHPLKSLKAGGEPRQEGMTEPSGVQPTPRSTMNRGAGQ
jgi:hypothetical protein